MIAHLFGPLEGKRHDMKLFQESCIEETLGNNQLFYGKLVYGDAGYINSVYFTRPYNRDSHNTFKLVYNKQMSSVRETVEWCIGHVSSLWKFVDFNKNLKLLLQLVGLYYSVAVFLTNIHGCYYSNQTSQYFNCPPPPVQVYLNKGI